MKQFGGQVSFLEEGAEETVLEEEGFRCGYQDLLEEDMRGIALALREPVWGVWEAGEEGHMR